MSKNNPGFVNNNTGYSRKDLPASFGRIGTILFAVGLVLSVIAFIAEPARAAIGYIPSFMFIVSIGVGALFFIALEYIAGAEWSVPFRRIMEFFASIVPLLIILALPLLFHLHDIFHWSHPGVVQNDPVLKDKSPYLNTSFFIIRVIVIFAIWGLFYWILIKNSHKQDKTGDQRLTKTNVNFSGGFMPLFAVTLTLVAIDWLMSLEPHWFSTIFGVYYFAGTAFASIAAITFAAVKLKEKKYLAAGLQKDHYYSLGTWMFAFTVFWAYIAFSQYMLIWYADIPEENFWFLHRWSGVWSYISVILVLAHFVVPFGALLSFPSKINPRRLKFISIWILAAHYLDLYWLVLPNMYNTEAGHYYFSWVDLVFPVFAVGLIMVVFNWNAKRFNLLPVGDPKLQRGLDFSLHL